MKLYGIKDVKAIAFNQPFAMPNDDIAIRGFTTLVNDGTSEISKYPEDFDLYYLGALDENTGAIISEVKFITNGQSLIMKEDR